MSPNHIKTTTVPQKFAKNSLFNFAGFIVSFPILIVVTPYMLNVLGEARFAIWALAAVVTSYTQLSDMGMTTTIVKFVAEYWKKGQIDKINEIISTILFTYIFVGGIVVVNLILFRELIVQNLLRVPMDLQNEAIFVITGITIIFYFNLVFSTYNSILVGLQRMDITNIITLSSKILQALGLWFFLSKGFGLKGLVINNAIISSLTIFANIAFVKKSLQGIEFQFHYFSWGTFKVVSSYSFNILIAKILLIFQLPVNKIIITRYVGLQFVAFYDVGERITKLIRQSFQIALQPLLPASAELYCKDEKNKIVEIFLKLSRLLYWFAVPIYALIISMAEPVIIIWLGEEYIKAALAIQFLSVGFLFSLLATPQYIILQGIGKPEINTWNAIICVVVNVIVGVFLSIKLGYLGVLIANIVSFMIAFWHLNRLMRKTLQIKLSYYIKNIPVTYIILVCIINIGIYSLREFEIDWNFFNVLSIFLGTIIIYTIIYMLTRNDEDKILINQLLKIVRFNNTSHL